MGFFSSLQCLFFFFCNTLCALRLCVQVSCQRASCELAQAIDRIVLPVNPFFRFFALFLHYSPVLFLLAVFNRNSAQAFHVSCQFMCWGNLRCNMAMQPACHSLDKTGASFSMQLWIQGEGGQCNTTGFLSSTFWFWIGVGWSLYLLLILPYWCGRCTADLSHATKVMWEIPACPHGDFAVTPHDVINIYPDN